MIYYLYLRVFSSLFSVSLISAIRALLLYSSLQEPFHVSASLPVGAGDDFFQTNVQHSSNSPSAGIMAYAQLVGDRWCYYVQSHCITIGRMPDGLDQSSILSTAGCADPLDISLDKKTVTSPCLLSHLYINYLFYYT
jgi:hypothetical protein